MSENDLWGFFNGEPPHHEDVEMYFTRENHLWMFGVEFEGTDSDLTHMKGKAHNIVAAIQEAQLEHGC